MSNNKEGLEKYRWDLVNCERCSMCKWVHPWSVKNKKTAKICPSNQMYKFDAYSAQGRFDLARALLEGEIEITDKVLEVIYTCTLCGGCDVTCKFTRDMEPLEIFHELRKYVVKEGKGPLPGHMPAVESIQKNDNPWQQPKTRRGNWARKLKVKDITKEKAEVLYFAGCTYSYNADLQKVAQATLRVLQKAGVDVGILGNKERCCASPALKVGVEDTFKEIASDNIKTFNELGVKTVITSCSGCYGIFQGHYPELGERNYEVYQAMQYLDKLLKEGKLEFKNRIDMKVTWHDPCHLGRGGEPQDLWEGTRIKWGLSDPPRRRNYGSKGVYDEPRNVLKAIPGIELVEMDRIREFSWCCGAGGGVRSAYPEFAMFSARERIEEAKATGAEAIVSSCPWCESNLSDAIKADGNKIKMLSLVELVEQAL
ncbi:MAG: (Fe-S)-binding protein [Candidatus Schekmanbacteria bacterium]|nr:MAG: (Fe-S)-binding protein [Candidatus Schekmanbacteria bacterium]